MRTIVVAKVYVEQIVSNPGGYRADLGDRPKFTDIQVPRAMVWLNVGDAEDIVNAKLWAAREGYVVFCYDVSERDPLGRAKLDILKPARRR